MLDCFNEGFDDEESLAATLSQIPKVYLNFKEPESSKVAEDEGSEVIENKRKKFFDLEPSDSDLGFMLSEDDSNLSLREVKISKRESSRGENYDESDIKCRTHVNPADYIDANPLETEFNEESKVTLECLRP